MKENIKALIFDLDGTLADTIPAITEAVNMTLSRLGFPLRSESEIITFIGRGPRHLISKSIGKDDVVENKEIIDKALSLYDDMYAKTYMHTNTMYEGMLEVISSLSKKYTIAVLSNKQDEYVKALVKQLLPGGICKIAMGTVAGIPAKPDPSTALQLIRELGFEPEECALIGDGEIDILTAKNAGFDIVSVSWGYSSKDKLMALGAIQIVDYPNEILNIF